MKKLRIIAALLFCCMLLVGIAACNSDAEPDPFIINDVDLTDFLPLPLAGRIMPENITDNPLFTGTIEWTIFQAGFPEPVTRDDFEAGKRYDARLSLTAKKGYTFDGTEINSFFYPNGRVTNPAGSGTDLIVNVNFPDTPAETDITVFTTDLAAALPAPVRDRSPSWEFGINQYYGSVVWLNGDSMIMGDTDVFLAGVSYRANISVTPEFGYTFSGLANGTGMSHSMAQSAVFDLLNLTVTVQFGATPASGDIPVTFFNLTELVDKPMTNIPPSVESIDTEQFTGTLAWYYHDNTAISGILEKNRPFKGLLSLEAKDGFTFNGIPANVFHHDRTIWQANDPGTGKSLLVTIAFGMTSDEIIYLWDKDGVIITACCWTSQYNSFATSLIDGTSDTMWTYAWGSPAFTSWPQQITDLGFAGCSAGHPEALTRPAHFFTLDLRRLRNISKLRVRPAWHEKAGSLFIREYEIFTSTRDIGVNPVSDGAVSWKTGSFADQFVGAILNQPATFWGWYDIDLTRDDGTMPLARYIQIRVYSHIDTLASDGPLGLMLMNLEAGVLE